MSKKIFIVIPAYNARDTIEKTIQRIPDKIYNSIHQIIIVEDCNENDQKSASNKLLKSKKKCKPLFHKLQSGYGAAQKTGYKYCLENNCFGVILLHADGQYDPEYLSSFIDLLEKGYDVIQGSRMVEPRKALLGGMPHWKYFLNKLVTSIENLIFNTNFSEFHSGYVAYSSKALKKISFEKLSDTFHFDGEMLIMTKIKNLKFIHFSISSYYGKETSSLNPFKYGLQVLSVILKYLRGYYHKI